MASDRLQRRLERLLDEAEEAITQLDWRVVYDRSQAVLAIDPENSDGVAFLATAERALATSASTATSEAPTSAPTAVPQAVPASQPTSFANGRYQVRRFLGEGGKKKVYLAQDTLLDREVAFALIKTEGLDDASRTRIQREAQAMGRLLARHGSLLGQQEGAYDADQEAFARALTIAQSQGDVALECGRWPMLARYALTTARPQETIDVGLRAIELASRIDDPMHEATARYYTLLALAGNGDLEGARRHATVMLALAERLRDRQMLTNAYVANSLLCLLEGH